MPEWKSKIMKNQSIGNERSNKFLGKTPCLGRHWTTLNMVHEIVPRKLTWNAHWTNFKIKIKIMKGIAVQYATQVKPNYALLDVYSRWLTSWTDMQSYLAQWCSLCRYSSKIYILYQVKCRNLESELRYCSIYVRKFYCYLVVLLSN